VTSCLTAYLSGEIAKARKRRGLVNLGSRRPSAGLLAARLGRAAWAWSRARRRPVPCHGPAGGPVSLL